MREKCCAILGSPPATFPWGYDEEDPACAALRLLLLNRITPPLTVCRLTTRRRV